MPIPGQVFQNLLGHSSALLHEAPEAGSDRQSWRSELEKLPTTVLGFALEGLKAQVRDGLQRVAWHYLEPACPSNQRYSHRHQVELYRLFYEEHVEETRVEVEASQQVRNADEP